MLLALASPTASALAQADGKPKGVIFRIKPGSVKRVNTPIRFDVAATRFDDSVRKAVEAGPIRLKISYWGPMNQVPEEGKAFLFPEETRTIARGRRSRGPRTSE